jgi:hypothetical protein
MSAFPAEVAIFTLMCGNRASIDPMATRLMMIR